ncbi:oligogalacturonate lyase family protein [Lachnotalea sp. AF33-28]|uniref:oligogalacturonate lyase family protein n=1 Tax=Lachnotalea sp. AF33-28 TaxID=2292046 RepID=UPI000E4F2914|nr:oligogalacturonate lyase family protein [Lachnotalea sp. AF33-28]RHP33546.1 hypothetical protein DWZ56_10015 [Lachnotalea sp. AF33-28]
MAIGDKIQNHFTTETDQFTGIKVTRLTEPDHTSHHMYFYNRMTTADGSKLLMSQERENGRQLYLMDLATGEAEQLTDGTGVADYDGLIFPNDKELFFSQDGVYYRMDLDTKEKSEIYRSPEGWRGGAAGMSDDFRFMAIIETKQDTTATQGKKAAGWNSFAANCLAKPLCRVVYIDVDQKTSRVVLEQNCWFGHPQIRPGDPDTIMFCHEGPYDLIDARLWLVQSDGSNLRCCREQPNDLILTHEFWLPDGSKLAFVYRETTGDKIENIRMIDPVTLEEEILMPCSPYAHFICDKQNKYMVGDSQSGDVPIHMLTEEDRRKAKESVGNDFLYLVDVEKRREYKLCYHGTSWSAEYGNSQDTHPHPFFTEDNKSVIFTSDKAGRPCIYKIDLKDVPFLNN